MTIDHCVFQLTFINQTILPINTCSNFSFPLFHPTISSFHVNIFTFSSRGVGGGAHLRPHVNFETHDNDDDDEKYTTQTITIEKNVHSTGFMKTRAGHSGSGAGSAGGNGNYGLMDVIAALHWTKENIAAFGGDPLRITIVGHDTGAALANLVLISKAGKGKFGATFDYDWRAAGPRTHSVFTFC